MKQIKNLNLFFYSSIFIVTQVTGVLLSIMICFMLRDFTWGFFQMALMNSFILGIALISGCYLSQKLVFKMKVVYIVSISFSLVVGIGIISFFILLFLEPTVFIYYNRGAFSFLIINFLFIIAFHVISSGLIIYRELMVEKEKAIGNERYLKNQMEMKLLSSRVNPHFLFNTLNMIINLLKQPQKAELAILNLSDLLRENLERSEKNSIAISEEIENVRKYLEIQKLRFDEKLHYEISCEVDFFIPPLIIQPLVENSIKHNMQKGSFLEVEIKVYSDNKSNIIEVTDSVRLLDPSMLNKGQGLTITKKRVESSSGLFSIKNGGIEISFSYD